MNTEQHDVIGIAGWGIYTPKKFMDAAEIAAAAHIPEKVIREKFGVDRKPIPGPEDTTAAMGLAAARKALEMSNVRPEEIDIVIWNGAQHKDFPCWLAGLDIAHELGAVNAWSFDMEAMCGSMMAGMETARSLMLANKQYNNVLLISGYRNADLIDFNTPETSFMFDLGAGGAALLLQKGYPKNHILGTAFRGDGSFSRMCTVKVGGSRKWPMEPADIPGFHFTIDDPETFKAKLGEKTLPNFFAVIDEALTKGNLTRKNLDYLAILHFKKSTHDYIIKELELSEEQTTYLNQYGHVGQNDQIIS
ncbi:MAG: hypothetical protein CSA76_00550, partial [Spirochaetales bacterium]